MLTIDAQGDVTDVALEQRTRYRRLDESTAACLAAALYVPQRENGAPVASRQRLRWTWRLED